MITVFKKCLAGFVSTAFMFIFSLSYAQDIVPLKLWWGDQAEDNFTLATAEGEQIAISERHRFIRFEGYIYSSQKPDTVPLKLFGNQERGDFFSTATAEGEQAAINFGYKFAGIEGYIYSSQKPGTVPLKLYWSSQRQDNFTVATAQGEQAAINSDYIFVRTEGYIYPGHPCAFEGSGQLGLEDAITALQFSAGMNLDLNCNPDVDSDGRTGLEEAVYALQIAAQMRTAVSGYAGAYYSNELEGEKLGATSYRIVVDLSGDVYLADFHTDSQGNYDYHNHKLVYLYNSIVNMLSFDWQDINGIQRKGEISFFVRADGKKAFSGLFNPNMDGGAVSFSGIRILKTQIWATPVDPVTVPVINYEVVIGDHTWLTMDEKSGSCWRVLGAREFGGGDDGYYCSPDKWRTVGTTQIYFPPEGRFLDSTADGNEATTDCMGGIETDFLGIPKYAGIVYGIHGVCHQMTNRLLLSAERMTVEGAVNFPLTATQYGVYGTVIPLPVMALMPIPLAVLQLTLDSDFQTQCSNCGAAYPFGRRMKEAEATGMSGSEKLALDVLKLHQERKTTLPREIFRTSPEDLKAFLLENHEIHMKELRLLFEFKAGNSISDERMNKLLSLYDEMLRPSESLLNTLADNIPKSADEMQAMQRRASEVPADPLLLADKINEAFISQQKQVANFLTRSEYVMLFGCSPDENISLIDPRIMLNNRK